MENNLIVTIPSTTEGLQRWTEGCRVFEQRMTKGYGVNTIYNFPMVFEITPTTDTNEFN